MGACDIAPVLQAGDRLAAEGTVVVTWDSVFGALELSHLRGLLSKLPEEVVSAGDAGDQHSLYVSRLATDGPASIPERVNRPTSDAVFELLEAPRPKSSLSAILSHVRNVSGTRWTIRRCQAHRLVVGSYVGVHRDIDSNPDNHFAVTVMLSSDYDGGQFIVTGADGSERHYRPAVGEVLITDCRLSHRVAPVTRGERRVLVYFYSSYNGPNRREEADPCPRPDCAWCQRQD
ncbi:2OG-Fe(II) oxygenase [Streptomyces capparidis]